MGLSKACSRPSVKVASGDGVKEGVFWVGACVLRNKGVVE